MLNFTVLEHLLSFSTLCIAYSGGIDSHVLLHLCAELREVHPEISLKAIHINHHISPNAEAWAKHCAKLCTKLNIPLITASVQLVQRKELGLEGAARVERYRIFAEILQENAVLLTAHNANDQAETVLLQLLRGAGPKGVAAMPRWKNLGKGKLVRPLLNVSRAEIENYAKKHNLEWIEDESNVVEDYARNFLRQQIMPQLLKQWPAALNTLARSAEHCNEASELLEDLACADLAKIQGAKANQLSLLELKKLKKARQVNVLRYWFKQLGFAVPETKQLNELSLQLWKAKHDAELLVAWQGVECRRFNDYLYVMPPQKPLRKKSFRWPEERALLTQELGELKAQQIAESIEQLSQQFKASTNWSIRFREGGEQYKMAGRQGTHKLKKLFQEWRIPPWERERIPLIYYADPKLPPGEGVILVGVVGSPP